MYISKNIYMNTNRVMNIIVTELSVQHLKLQEKLEQDINSNEDINNKVDLVKKTLRELAITELMISKLQSTTSNNNNNENEN